MYPYKQNMYASMKPKRREPSTAEPTEPGSNKRPRLKGLQQISDGQGESQKGRESAELEEGEVALSYERASTTSTVGKGKKPSVRPIKEVVDMRVTKHKETPLERHHFIRLVSAKDIILEIFSKIERYGCGKDSPVTDDDLNKIRHQLHNLAFDSVSRAILERSNIIPKALSLLTLQSSSTTLKIPEDIISDANWLKRKWQRADFSTDLLRGIVIKQRKYNSTDPNGLKSGTSYNLDKEYPHKISPYCPGHNGLEVGAWWPLQICALRDGAHGEIEAGIHGSKELGGALSIVLSSGGYNDFDEGETIFYCGTKSSDGKLSVSTQYMMQSLETSIPVRVLRSSKCKESRFRPSQGIRYDGLYKVTGHALLKEVDMHYRFTLQKVAGQPPIRYDAKNHASQWTKRPNQVEEYHWDEIKRQKKIDW